MTFTYILRFLAFSFILVHGAHVASLPLCSKTGGSQPDHDFVVIGSGVGGGPLAARLAENGFSGLSYPRQESF
jgi:choline dehydrogenase